MIRHIIGIGGEPATGKTELVKPYQGTHSLKFAGMELGTIKMEKKLIVLGLYQREDFGGTDALSMAVQPKVIAFLDYLDRHRNYDGYNVLFEGDRLFNKKFIVNAAKYHCTWVILYATESEKQRRHLLRGDTQNQIFLKGRATKYKNLMSQFDIQTWRNEGHEDHYNNNLKLLKLLDE